MLVWLAMGNPGLAGDWWANKELILNSMFARRKPKRPLRDGTGKSHKKYLWTWREIGIDDFGNWFKIKAE